MVSNKALAQVAEQYKIPDMVIAEQSSKYMLQGGVKVTASLFEAYVAGVYYSFLHPREGELVVVQAQQEDGKESPGEETSAASGKESDEAIPESESARQSKKLENTAMTTESLDTCESRTDPSTPPVILSGRSQSTSTSSSGDDLPKPNEIAEMIDKSHSPTPSDDSITPTLTIKINPSSSKRTHGEAFDHICSWLCPLFHPIVIFLTQALRSDPQLSSISLPTAQTDALEVGRAQYVEPEEWKLNDMKAEGAVGALTQFLGRSYGCGVFPTWLTKSKGQQIWKLTCIVKTPEGKEM